MPHPLTLESFEEAVVSDEQPDAAFEAGYAAGYEAGQSAAEAAVAHLSAQLVQNLSEMEFTFEEARLQVLDSLGPLFAALTEKILPHCVATGFAGQLAAALEDAAQQDLAAPVVVHLHPDNIDAVTEALASLRTKVTVRSDPALAPHTAWIGHGMQETRLDMDRVLAGITDALGAFHETRTKVQSNG